MQGIFLPTFLKVFDMFSFKEFVAMTALSKGRISQLKCRMQNGIHYHYDRNGKLFFSGLALSFVMSDRKNGRPQKVSKTNVQGVL